jgi:hypothetical protein
LGKSSLSDDVRDPYWAQERHFDVLSKTIEVVRGSMPGKSFIAEELSRQDSDLGLDTNHRTAINYSRMGYEQLRKLADNDALADKMSDEEYESLSTELWRKFSLQKIQRVGDFGRGVWRYWRFGEPAPESNWFVQKLYAYTDGRSNDLLFRILESKRKETDLKLGWDGPSLVSDAGILDPSIEGVVRTLKEDGVVVIPLRLKKEAVQNLYELALSCSLETSIYGSLPTNHVPGTQWKIPIVETGTSSGIDLSQPRCSYYGVPRALLLENHYVQCLLCDPYLLAVATRYLGVFPVITKPAMWWDTDFLPAGLRPRPFHVDSGCLRWLKVGVNLTDTTLESPHFVYVKGSHNPNKSIKPLIRRLTSRMTLSDKEVSTVCPDKIVHITAPAGSITLTDTRGIHKGELSERGHRLILYFGLEGSAFNNLDGILPLNKIGSELGKAMSARPFSYQFFRATREENRGGSS